MHHLKGGIISNPLGSGLELSCCSLLHWIEFSAPCALLFRLRRRREGRWTPIRAKAQDPRVNPNSWETHLVRERWDIVLLRSLNPWIITMMIVVMSNSLQ